MNEPVRHADICWARYQALRVNNYHARSSGVNSTPNYSNYRQPASLRPLPRTTTIRFLGIVLRLPVPSLWTDSSLFFHGATKRLYGGRFRADEGDPLEQGYLRNHYFLCIKPHKIFTQDPATSGVYFRIFSK